MNVRATMIGLLICAVVLFAALERGRAAAEPAPVAAKIGVLSVRGVFDKSARYAQQRSQSLSNQSRARSELEDLAKDIQAEEAGLKALKPGTPDYLKQLQTTLEKRAKLESQQEYLKQQLLLDEKAGLEGLYQEVVKIVQVVAKEKGLNLVLERTESQFPMPEEELRAVLSLGMARVLYADGCVDLTADVTSRLDAAGSAKPQ